MTDRQPSRRHARPRRPRPTLVIASSLALFLAVFALLAWQMRAGRDPALSAVAKAARPPAPRRVVVRRVVVTKRHVVIVEDEDEEPSAASAAPAAPPGVRTS